MDGSNLLFELLATLGGLGVMVGIAGLGLFLFLRSLRRRNRVEPLEAGPGALRGDPICPGCGNAMLPGFVTASKGINWRDVQDSPGMLVSPWASLPNTVNAGFSPAENVAWRCERCQVLILDHSRLVSRSGRP